MVATPAQAIQITVLQFNMCGWDDNPECANEGRARYISVDIYRSLKDKGWPLVVSLNEACKNQVDAVAGLTKTHDGIYYDVVFQKNKQPGATCQFGNALMIRRGRTESRIISHVAVPYIATPSGFEPRGFVCASIRTPGMHVCSTHLTPDKEGRDYSGVRSAQVGELVRYLTRQGWAQSGVRTLIAGDFNAKPGADELDRIYKSSYGGGAWGVFNEVDGCCSTRGGESTHGSSKIDYIFYFGNFVSMRGDATLAPHSDHDPLWGWITL
ncbi:MAG: hypothetical protein HY308_09010 [Gammaproteobacteria bacterium]|nr:hypothetical protein [Gammaproteobacteria bacterium]